jgi:hypothetical protein
MVAPAANLGGADRARVPFSLILPACDQDGINQDRQLYYKITQLNPGQSAWASSVWLERANHYVVIR